MGAFIAGNFNPHGMVLTDPGQPVRQRLVGNEMAKLRDAAKAHRGRALEFHGIGNQDGLPAVLDDRLGYLDLPVVEVKERSVLVDRRDSDNGKTGG